MQLIAQKNFTVVRQISDHTDVNTYYVRAVIRNAYTDAIIATLDLDSKGSQRFKKDWKVPAIPENESYYISVITSVYTDSGYTAKSASYGDEENTYQIVPFESVNLKTGAGFGGGSLSRRDIRDIISEELEKVKPDPIKIPEQKDVDFSDVMEAIKKVENKIKEPIKPEKVDLKPIKQAIDALKSAIEAIEMPNLDLSSVLKKIDDMGEINDIDKDDIKAIVKESAIMIVNQLEPKLKKVLGNVKVVSSNIETSKFVIGKDKKNGLNESVEEEEPEKPLDIKKLSD